jgi:hypothetical protein
MHKSRQMWGRAGFSADALHVAGNICVLPSIVGAYDGKYAVIRRALGLCIAYFMPAA